MPISVISCVPTPEDIVLLGTFDPIHCSPLIQIYAFEFEFILDVVLIGRAPVPGFRSPATNTRVLCSGQEGDLVEEIIDRLMVVFGEPSSEFIGIFAIAVNVASTQLEKLLNNGS